MSVATGAYGYGPRRQRRTLIGRFFASRFVAVVLVAAVILAIWYAGAAYLNAPFQHQLDANAGRPTPELVTFVQVHLPFGINFWLITNINPGELAKFIGRTWTQERPVLPTPYQVAEELYKTVILLDPTSKRSLVYHGWITLSSTLAGFVLGTLLGILL